MRYAKCSAVDVAPTIPLSKFVALKRGYDLPARQRRYGDVPILGSFGITGWHDTAKKDGPGVTIGRSGASFGVATFWDGPFWPLNTTLYVSDFHGNHPRFVFFVLSHIDFRGYNSGSAQPSLNRNFLAGIPVPSISRNQQATIASILGALDDLIENNRRRIELLEQMAQSIYREWFVHLHFPGHEDSTFVGSPLGPIPDDWGVTTLGEAATWLSGGTPKTAVADYWDGPIPWITSGSLTSLLLDCSPRTLTSEGVSSGSRLVDRDTLLFVVRGMSLVKEFRVGIADVPLAFGQDCKALLARPGIAPLFLAFSVIAMADKIQKLVELAGHGTGKLSTDRLRAFLIPQPPTAIQSLFVDVVSPHREMMTAIRRSTSHLAAIRDLLLPKLLTGKIDVSRLDLDAVGESVA